MAEALLRQNCDHLVQFRDNQLDAFDSLSESLRGAVKRSNKETPVSRPKDTAAWPSTVRGHWQIENSFSSSRSAGGTSMRSAEGGHSSPPRPPPFSVS